MKCIIVDNEKEAIDEIIDYSTEVSWIEVVNTFTNPIEALNYCKANEIIDILFVDIDMPIMSGIELSRMVRDRVKNIIFTTSHSKYALDAFEVNAAAFLLKPFNFARFLTIMEKFKETDNIAKEVEPTELDFVFVKSKEADFKLVKVFLAEILAVESKLNYIQIYTVKGKITTHMSLKEAKDLLKEKNNLFIQLHRSFLIAVNHIASIEGNYLTMSDGSKFAIGENYKKELNIFLEKKVFRSTQRK